MLCTTDTDVAFVTITHMFSLCQDFSWDPVKICKTGDTVKDKMRHVRQSQSSMGTASRGSRNWFEISKVLRPSEKQRDVDIWTRVRLQTVLQFSLSPDEGLKSSGCLGMFKYDVAS